MSFTPIAVGDASAWHNIFTVDGGTPFPLTGLVASNLSMHYVDLSSSTLVIGTGTWLITDIPGGKADYTPAALEVAVAGFFRTYPVAQLSTGPRAFDPQVLEIKALR